MCLPAVRMDYTWTQSAGLPSLSAAGLGFRVLPWGITCLGAGEGTLAPTHCRVPLPTALCTAVLAAYCWDLQRLSASLSLWYLLYDLLGRGRCKDKQEEEVVQRRISRCICSSPSSRVNQVL